MSDTFNPYAPMDAVPDEEQEALQYDFADAIDTINLDGEDVKITENNRFLVDDNSDYIDMNDKDKSPTWDVIKYHATVFASLEEFKEGVVLERGKNLRIAQAKAIDVNENNMVADPERQHQDLVGPIKGIFSTNLNIPMEVQLPIENAPGIVSYDSKYATEIVNADANATGAPTPFTLLENRLTEKGLKWLMKNVGVARNTIKENDIVSSADRRGLMVVKQDSTVVRSIMDFLDDKDAKNKEPVIEVRLPGGSIKSVRVMEPKESDMGGYTIPEVVYDFFHEDTVAHTRDNVPSGDVTSSAFRPRIKIPESLSDLTFAGDEASGVRATLLLEIPYKRLLRNNK